MEYTYNDFYEWEILSKRVTERVLDDIRINELTFEGDEEFKEFIKDEVEWLKDNDYEEKFRYDLGFEFSGYDTEGERLSALIENVFSHMEIVEEQKESFLS